MTSWRPTPDFNAAQVEGRLAYAPPAAPYPRPRAVRPSWPSPSRRSWTTKTSRRSRRRTTRHLIPQRPARHMTARELTISAGVTRPGIAHGFLALVTSLPWLDRLTLSLDALALRTITRQRQ
jgi:hypothetical protein